MLSPAEIDRIVDRIVAQVQPERIMLIGSYAKRTATPKSDLDLLVIMDTPLPRAKRASRLQPAIDGHLVPIDAHVYTPEEIENDRTVPYSFIHTVLRSGRTVYSQI
jgi:predicted nucleotidyltransferase